MARYQMIVDLDKCIGCDSCTAACMQENGLEPGIFYTKVHFRGAEGTFPAVEEYYLPMKCQHCDTPSCVSVCPTAASYKRDDGLVLVDHNKCIGCQYCVMACPYGVRTMNESQKVIEKCTSCAHMVDAGQSPACAQICPAHARIFGDLDDSSSEAAVYLAEHASSVHKMPDIGNNPGDIFILSTAAWKE